MRISTFVGLGLVLFGCQQNAEPVSEEELPGDGPAQDVAEAVQASQLADGTVFNLVDFAANPTIAMSADATPLTVNVFYVSEKTTDAGHQPGQLYLRQTLALAADQTKTHVVNLNHLAFAGGYGSVFVDAAGSSPFDVFQATVFSAEGGAHDVGGSVFMGGSFRIPYLGGSSQMVIAITNVTGYTFDVQLSKPGSSFYKAINLPPLSTYKFDSVAQGWTLGSAHGFVQIFTTAGGVVNLNGYTVKSTTKYRLNPVKIAPYF